MATFVNKSVDRWAYILDKCQSKRVLNIGCLAADKKSALHNKIEEVAGELWGMDLHESEMRNYIKADAQAFSLDGSFDVIVAGEVIEHLHDIKGFIESCARALKKGGCLIITTPNAYNFVFLRKAMMGSVVPNDPYHVVLFDITTLRNLITHYASSYFSGTVFYYFENNPQSLLYRINNLISKLRFGYSMGIVAELHRL